MDPGIKNSEDSWSQGFSPWEDPASADWPGEDLPKSNGESLYSGGNEFWGAVALPDWSNQHSAQRTRKPKNWCNGCQCEHPWSKNGYTFHVRSRRANAYLRSLQLAGEVPNIDPMRVEPLEWSSSAPPRAPNPSQNGTSSSSSSTSSTKTYYTPHTGGIPRYFYHRFPLLAEQAQWAYGYGESDSQITSHGHAPSFESDLNTVNQASRKRPASDRAGRRRHIKKQRQAVMKSGRSQE